jgi:ABC-type sugar transport system ATPase subunit
VRLVNDRVPPGDAGPGSRAWRLLDGYSKWYEARRIRTRALVVHGGMVLEPSRNRSRVRVEQQQRWIVPQALLRLPGPVGAQSITLARPDAGHEAGVISAVVASERVPLLGSRRFEEAKLDGFGGGGRHRDMGTIGGEQEARHGRKRRLDVVSAIAMSAVSLAKDRGTILDHVDLNVEVGERLCVLGGSGSGKTALLRAMAGLDRPARGELTVMGSKPKPERPDVTMIFQEDAAYDHLDVRGNLDFPFTLGVDDPDRADRVRGTATTFSIWRLLPRRTTELSSGQRRLVSAARALVRRGVAVVLMDEPLVGTDPKRRIRLVERVMERPELTVVMATHEPGDAFRWADRVAVLEGGRLAQIGPPADVYARPSTLEVAELIGEVNRFPAVASLQSQGWCVDVGDSRLLLGQSPPGLRDGERVVAAVRPPDLEPASAGIPFHHRLRATVGRVELVGPSQRVLFGLGSSRGIGFVAQIGASVSVEAGDSLDWYVPPDAIRLYEPVTGNAL